MGQGSVYAALLRLQHRGLIDSQWGVSENKRRARFYRITPLGRRALKAETDDWRRYTQAVELVLRAT